MHFSKEYHTDEMNQGHLDKKNSTIYKGTLSQNHKNKNMITSYSWLKSSSKHWKQVLAGMWGGQKDNAECKEFARDRVWT